MKGRSVLLVDDDKKALLLLADALKSQEFSVLTTTFPTEALKIVQENSIDAVVLDLVMPGSDGIEILKAIKQMKPHLPVIMLSGHGTIPRAIESIRIGAYDFLEKDVRSEQLFIALRHAITQADLEIDKHNLLERVREKYRIISVSPAMQEIFSFIDKIAATDSPVLITGENGTGKELIANAIHFKSERAAKPFVALNCAAIPETLFESELFGHEKGAFTGAEAAKPGHFEQAHQGTLFLDEISEMALNLQPKLLRAIESKEIKRLGGTAVKQVDLRIISATNKDLHRAVGEKAFREDLFYRVAVLTIDVPPLRERKEDIPLLVKHFTGHFCAKRKIESIEFHPLALELFLDYHWPGNIRQLKNVIEKIVILSDEREILPEVVLPYLRQSNGLTGGAVYLPAETLDEARKKAEKEKLLAKLLALDWDYEKTAAELGISRATLFNKMKDFGISKKKRR